MNSNAKAPVVQCTEASREIAQASLITPLVQRSMFWRPAYLEQSAWLEHIPFAFWLVEAHRPRTIVELGAHYGVSYFAFCQAVDRLGLDTRCFAVDTWKGDEHAGLYDERVFEQVRAHNDAQYSGFSRLVRSSFDDAVKHFENGSIDLLHIDGLHTFEAVLHDFETWRPKLSERGIVIMHDINVRERGFGVFKLFEKLKKQYPHFEFAHGHGLGVLGLGADQEDIIERLFQASADEHTRQALHEVFGRLGRACADALAATKQQERAKALTGEFEKQKKQLDELKQSLEKTKADLIGRARELNDAKALLQNQIEQHAVERGHLAERVSLLQELRTELKEEVARLHARVEVASNELSEKSNQLATLTHQSAGYQQQINEANERVKMRDGIIAELTEKLDIREAELARVLAAREESDAESERVQQSLQETISQRGKEIAALTKMLEKSEAELHANIEEARAHQERSEKLKAEMKVKTEALDRAEKQLPKGAPPESGTNDTRDVALDKLKAENNKLKADLLTQSKKLDDRFKELAILTRMLEERDHQVVHRKQEVSAAKKRQAKLNNSILLMLAAPAGVLRMRLKKATESSLMKKQARLIDQSGMFDRDWYLTKHPDVAASNIDPVEHYIKFGAKEGRDPGPNFNTHKYLAVNPSLALEGTNPLVHYLLIEKNKH